MVLSDLTLLLIVVGGAGASASVVFVAVARRSVREVQRRHRSRVERLIRPLLLEAITEGRVDPRLIRARRARGRSVERVALHYLAKTRGEARDVLEGLLTQRGVTARAIRQTGRLGPHRRARAAEVLGVIASDEARKCLEHLGRVDPKMEVRTVAARALGKFETADAAASLLGLLYYATPVPGGVVAAGLIELGPEAIPALRDVLRFERRGSITQRAMAAEVLGLLGAAHVWRELAAEAGGADLESRISAVRALGRLGVPGAADTIAQCLQPAEPIALRSAAARALGGVGATGYASVLEASVNDRDYWVAHRSAEALTELGVTGQGALQRLAAQPTLGGLHAREALGYAALEAVAYLTWTAPIAPPTPAVSWRAVSTLRAASA